jgi:pimeloyl-ACP methyl ester carboxylesterase
VARYPIFPLVLIFPLLAAGGCAGIRQEVRQQPPEARVPAPREVVFVADGVGGYGATTASLRHVAAEQNLPLCVEQVEWSHGYGRIVADQVDYDNVRQHGACLAARVCAYRRLRPDSKIYLVGHSAGSAVVLAAAEGLPPGSVERIILLAPAVSADYNLRSALRTACKGIDAFYSERDTLSLGMGVALLGTTDRRWTAAAGRVGFNVCGETPEDAILFRKLRQHPWDPSVIWTGNNGGHYATYQPCYLRYYVLPLLTEQ